MFISEKHVKTDAFELKLEDGIIYARYISPVVVDLVLSKKVLEARKQISQGKAYPILGFGENVKYWTKDARAFHNSAEYYEGIKAVAMVVDNPVSRILMNFYLKTFPKQFPIKAFTKEPDAINWIEQFREAASQQLG